MRITVIAVLLGAVAVMTCDRHDPCRNTLAERIPSPDQQWDAIVFQRACGATSRPSTQASVLPAGSAAPQARGNAYIAYQDIGISARWLSPDQLLLEAVTTQQEIHRAPAVSGVEISVVDLGAARFDSVGSAPIIYTRRHLERTSDDLVNAYSAGDSIPGTLAEFLSPAVRIAPYHAQEYVALDAWGRLPRLDTWADSFALTSAGPDTSTTVDDIRYFSPWTSR